MKRLFIILAVLIFAAPAMAQTWHNANQGTFAWDAVTTLAGGATIPTGNVVKYQAWKRLSPALPTAGEMVGTEITALQQTVSFSVEGGYFVGVQALRFVDNVKVSTSTISWSDVPANCQGGVAFGFQYWLALALPQGLRQVP
jgi:hypothetical protein